MIPIILFSYGYNCLILLFVFAYIFKQRTKNNRSTQLYLWTVALIVITQIFEALAWFINHGIMHHFVGLNKVFTFFSYLLSAYPVIAFFMYLDTRIIKDYKSSMRRNVVYALFLLGHSLIVIFNLFYHYLYIIDAEMGYQRMPGMYLLMAASISALAIYIYNVRYKIKYADTKVISVFLVFAAIPVIGAFVQLAIYGLPALWSFFTLLILFTFIVIEREDVLKDALTGLDTRAPFERHLKHNIKRKQAFTLLMIDLNAFKPINDTYGHLEGDEVLKIVSNILKRSVKCYDMTCRFGGDEFVMIVESDKSEMGEVISRRILEDMDDFNQKKVKPYTIGLSIGHLFVSEQNKQSDLEILEAVDQLMYKQKMNKRENALHVE